MAGTLFASTLPQLTKANCSAPAPLLTMRDLLLAAIRQTSGLGAHSAALVKLLATISWN